MSMVSYLAAQVARVTAFAVYCAKYTLFKPLIDTMNSKKTDLYVMPLRVQEIWTYHWLDPNTNEFFRVGKIRTVNETQSLEPGYEPVTNYTDVIYTMPSLIADEQVITKEAWAVLLADKMHLVANTGMERIIEQVKEEILIALMDPNVAFGGMDQGYEMIYCGRDSLGMGPKWLHTRVMTLFRPGADKWNIVDGVEMTEWH